MYILYGQISLFLPFSSSLKDKRQTIQSIIARSRKRFNISICEVEFHDLWQRSNLGYAASCSLHSEAVLIIDSIKNTLDYYQDLCEITNFAYEIIDYKHLE